MFLFSLWNNLLTHLDEKIFQDLHRLKEIDLSRNRIACLQPETFSGLENLEKIYLHGNELSSDYLELNLKANVKFISFKNDYENNDIKYVSKISS